MSEEKDDTEREWLVKSSCLGCCIHIIAFKRHHVEDVSVYLTLLSDHAHLYRNSWRGRLRFAWQALRGNIPSHIDLETFRDLEYFKIAMDEAYRWALDKTD
jgi:hypothetical protein